MAPWNSSVVEGVNIGPTAEGAPIQFAPNDKTIYIAVFIKSATGSRAIASYCRLDQNFRNENGQMLAPGEGFSKNARNIRKFVGEDDNGPDARIFCELLMNDKKTWKKNVVDLSQYFQIKGSTKWNNHIAWVSGKSGLKWWDEGGEIHDNFE